MISLATKTTCSLERFLDSDRWALSFGMLEEFHGVLMSTWTPIYTCLYQLFARQICTMRCGGRSLRFVSRFACMARVQSPDDRRPGATVCLVEYSKNIEF